MSKNEGRTEKPTQRRRKKARRDGRVARSAEVATALSFVAALTWARALVPRAAHALADGTRTILAESAASAPGRAVRTIALRMLLIAVVPVVTGAAVAGFGGAVTQAGLTISPGAIKPKWERVSPKNGLKKFSPATMGWEGARTGIKLALVAAVCISPIHAFARATREGHDLSGWLTIAGTQISQILVRVALAAILVAAADYALSRRKLMKTLRMTKQEVKQEHREQEGDPLVKHQRRRRHLELSRNRMIADVTLADVVVTNPTHFAVALKYETGQPAPRVIAKGSGRFALKLRKTAARHGVPITEDPPLARALFRQCKVGAFVPPALWRAVAVVLAVAYRRRRAGAA